MGETGVTEVAAVRRESIWGASDSIEPCKRALAVMSPLESRCAVISGRTSSASVPLGMLTERRNEADYDESSERASTRCMASFVLSSLAWKAWVPRLVRCSSP